MSNEEDEYFKKQDLEKIAQARRAEQLASIHQQEQSSIQVALNTNEEVAAEALSLGFDGETARVLPLVPMIQMAWIDGTVSKKERERLTELAEGFGIQKDTPAGEFLEILINERPSDVFFGRVTQVVARMINEDPKLEIRVAPGALPRDCRDLRVLLQSSRPHQYRRERPARLLRRLLRRRRKGRRRYHLKRRHARRGEVNGTSKTHDPRVSLPRDPPGAGRIGCRKPAQGQRGRARRGAEKSCR